MERLRVVAAVSKSPLLAMLVALGAMVFGVLLISAATNDPGVLVGIALTTGLAMAVVAIIVAVRRSRARRALPEGADPYHVAYRTLVSQIAIPRV